MDGVVTALAEHAFGADWTSEKWWRGCGSVPRCATPGYHASPTRQRVNAVPKALVPTCLKSGTRRFTCLRCGIVLGAGSPNTSQSGEEAAAVARSCRVSRRGNFCLRSEQRRTPESESEMNPQNPSAAARTRLILEDLEAVRENLLALSDDIWSNIDRQDLTAFDEGVQLAVGSNLYMEANLSANSIRDVVRRLCEIFEIRADRIQIFLRQDRDAGRGNEAT